VKDHVPSQLLAAFIEGDISEHLAAHIAEHLDACPRCLNQATALEPLAMAFASIDDPEPPSDLVHAVLAEVAEQERAPAVEMVVGAGLIVAAGLFAALAGNPGGLIWQTNAVLSALFDGGLLLSYAVQSSLVLSVATVAALAGGLATFRLSNSVGSAQSRRLI